MSDQGSLRLMDLRMELQTLYNKSLSGVMRRHHKMAAATSLQDGHHK